MKNNRRNRKLTFIRARNALTKGRGRDAMKISNTFIKIEPNHREVILYWFNDNANRYGKKYRITLVPIAETLTIGVEEDDFIKDITTARVHLSRVF